MPIVHVVGKIVLKKSRVSRLFCYPIDYSLVPATKALISLFLFMLLMVLLMVPFLLLIR